MAMADGAVVVYEQFRCIALCQRIFSNPFVGQVVGEIRYAYIFR